MDDSTTEASESNPFLMSVGPTPTEDPNRRGPALARAALQLGQDETEGARVEPGGAPNRRAGRQEDLDRGRGAGRDRLQVDHPNRQEFRGRLGPLTWGNRRGV